MLVSQMVFRAASQQAVMTSRPSSVFPECFEDLATRFATRVETDAEADLAVLPDDSALDAHLGQLRRDVPDVLEGDAGEVAAPAGGDGDSAQHGGDAVAEGLPHVEAFVAVTPHALNAVGVVGLANDLFEGDLQPQQPNISACSANHQATRVRVR